MRWVTGWIIGGLVTMALWIPGAGAQDNRQMYQGGNYGTLPANREAMHRDRRDLRTDHQNAWRGIHQDHRENSLASDRWEHRRDRARLRADHWHFWHDWRHRHHDHYNRW